MKKFKKLLVIAGALALVLTLLVPMTVFAAEGPVTTTFTGNDTPDVVVTLAGDLTPQGEASIDVLVTDADGLTDIASIVLKLYYDANTTTDVTEFGTMTPANAETIAWITWNGTTFVLTEETGSSWAIGTTSCATPAGGVLTAPFKFYIIPGKVSTEAANTTACWQVAALVTDDQGATGFDADNERAAMNWYGDITVITDSAGFGIEVPGTVFADATVGSISMKYISNGNYDEKVKVATDAFIGGTGTVTVDVTDFDAAAANEVAFMADDDAILGGAVGVTAAGATIDDADDITEETGDTVDTNSLWLQISSGYTATGVKTGSIYFVIASGS